MSMDWRGRSLLAAKGVFAGLLIGSMSVVFALSFAAIVYSGPLSPHLGQGMGLTLIGAVAMSAVGALSLSFRGAICQPQDVTAVLLSIAAAAIVGELGRDSDAAFATVAVMVGGSALAAGAAAYALGRMRLGFLARYVPFPVVCGFLAASGLLLARGAFDMAAPDGLADGWARWLPWLVFGVGLALASRLLRAPFLVPAALCVATLAFYLVLPIAGLSLQEARAAGLLLGPFDSGGFLDGVGFDLLAQADWGAIAAQGALIGSVIGLTILGALMNATGLELAIDREIKLDQDLKGVGLANMAAGVGGGMAGYPLLGETLLARRIGVEGAMAGLSVAAVCALVLLFGAGLLGSLPIGLFAGVVWFLGADLFLTAVWDHGRRMSGWDAAVVAITPALALIFDVQTAIAFGLLAAILIFVMACARVDVLRLGTTGASLRARVERRPCERARLARLGDRIHIYKLSGFLFFGTAHHLLERLQASLDAPTPPEVMLVDLKRVVGLDLSARAAFERLARRCRAKSIELVLTGVPASLSGAVAEGRGALTANGQLRIARDLDEELARLEEKLLEGAGGEPEADTRDRLDLERERELRSTLEKVGEKLRFAPGEIVIEEGAASDCLYLLLSGSLRVLISDGAGGTTTVNRLLPGAILGEVGLYTDLPRTATLVADEPCAVLRADFAALQRLENEAPDRAILLHRILAGILSRRLVAATQLLKDVDP